MKEHHNPSDLSLFRRFQPGDRVKRIHKTDNGSSKHIEGIIMSMNHDRLEIYWDTIDGFYCPQKIDNDFTICMYEDVVYGTKYDSPIKQKKILFV